MNQENRLKMDNDLMAMTKLSKNPFSVASSILLLARTTGNPKHRDEPKMDQKRMVEAMYLAEMYSTVSGDHNCAKYEGLLTRTPCTNLSCPVCENASQTDKNVHSHLKPHKVTVWTYCKPCGETFTKKSYLTIHVRVEVEMDVKGLVRTVIVAMRPRDAREKSLPYKSKKLKKLKMVVQRLVLVCPAIEATNILGNNGQTQPNEKSLDWKIIC